MTPPPDMRPAYLMYNQEKRQYVPFSYELLKQISVTEELFNIFKDRSREHEIPFLSTLMTREGGDATGLVPNLGHFHDPDDVKDTLLQITTPYIEFLHTLPEQEKEDIIQILHGIFSTPKALVTVDDIFGKIVQQLQSYRTKTSHEMRERARQALGLPPLITYTPTWEKGLNEPEEKKGKLIHIQQMYVVPPLSPQSQEILDRITPDVFKRSTSDQIFPPLSAEQFLRNAGRVGDPMAREIAQYCIHLVALQQQFRQREDLEKAAIREYCQSHP